MRGATPLPLALLAALALACGQPPPPADAKAEAQAPRAPSLPPLNAEAAREAVLAIGKAVPERRASMATQGLAEVEVGRLPEFLIEGLRASFQAAPDQRALRVAGAIDSVAGQVAWIQACRGGLQVLTLMAHTAPAGRSALLWRECGLADLRLADEATITAADPLLVILAVVAFDHLRRAGEVAPEERELLLAMLAPAAEG